MKAVLRFLSLISVEPVAFFYILNIYCEYALVQDMISTRICMTLSNSSNVLCDRTKLPSSLIGLASIQQAVAMKYYIGIMTAAAVIAAFFVGSWSDSIGRKPVMMLPSILGIIAEILFAACSLSLQKEWCLNLVFIASFFNGISGGVSTVISSCFGYITDITDRDNRSKRITLLEASIFIGGFLGFNVAGLLMQHVLRKRYEFAFLGCIMLHILITVYIKTIIIETRGRIRSQPNETEVEMEVRNNEHHSSQVQREVNNNTKTSLKTLFELNHVKSMVRTIIRKRPVRSSILLLCFCCICSFDAMSVQMTLTFAHVKNNPINWTSSTYSYYSGLNFLAQGLCLLIILPLIYRLIPRTQDNLIASLGFASKGIGLFNLGLARSSSQVFLGVAFFSLSEYTMPSIRSMLSKLVDEDERGKAYSFLGLLQSLTSFSGSFIFPSLYVYCQSFFPGLPFVVMSVTEIIAMLTVLFCF